MPIKRWVSMGFEELYSWMFTGTAVANNAIEWIAVAPGAPGNLVSVVLVDPELASQPLTVTVTDKKITVSLATDEFEVVTSTAAEVIAVVRVDGRTVGDGKPGPATRDLKERFHSLARG